MTTDPHFHIIDHPIIQDRLVKMREESCRPEHFRHYMREIARILAVETTRNLPLKDVQIETPLTQTTVKRLTGATPLIVPILRAGLGISQGFEEILTHADTGHIGLVRDEETHRPKEYLVKQPPNLNRRIFICDPMLATGHSLLKTIEILKKYGAKVDYMVIVTLLGAPEGLAEVRKHHKNLPIYTAALDSHLNQHAYIVPGLGDAGDRMFGTV
jgi:uracil phosphoribosyltransferase